MKEDEKDSPERSVTPTDLIAKAMEFAEEMEDVVVVWSAKDGKAGLITSCDTAEALLLLEHVKISIALGLHQPRKENDKS